MLGGSAVTPFSGPRRWGIGSIAYMQAEYGYPTDEATPGCAGDRLHHLWCAGSASTMSPFPCSGSVTKRWALAPQPGNVQPLAGRIDRGVGHPGQAWVAEQLVDVGDGDRRGAVVALVKGHGNAPVRCTGQPGDHVPTGVVVAEAVGNEVGRHRGAVREPVTGEPLRELVALRVLPAGALGELLELPSAPLG